ncbi:MAG: DUF1727 domain-containing protein [Ruminococcaceae bacterium]|nr:DUF1727 domain-containing protein [Oscillospiraceae bacterium]
MKFMNKLRFFIALFMAKLARLLLKMLGRNATYLPGEVALKISKDFLGHLKMPETVICVTGTNGKTTVSNLLASVFTKNGYDITNNSFGSNVQAGVAAALLADSDILGRAKKKIAVLEVDERSSLLVYPYIKPDFLVVNNIMRDSIKRNAHTGFISYIISSSLPEKTKLILNGDDLITASLAKQCKNRVYFGLDAEKPEISEKPFLSDIVYCPECGNLLESEYLRYNHIGRMHCTSCQVKSPERDYLVTDIDRENEKFTVSLKGKEHTFNLINDNIVNVYNFAGAIALLTEAGLDISQTEKGFSESEIVKTRFDTMKAGKLNITFQMAKGQNPIACARCYSYMASIPVKNKLLIIDVDDLHDNIGESESTCWLYDCDYSYLKDESIAQIIFAGPRCRDQLLRALIQGVSKDKIVLCEDVTKAVSLIDTEKFNDIYVLYELYRQPDADKMRVQLKNLGEGTK